tara:strand:+ start:16106 stop:16252 length:147 start_codon:yes stop_codon:yes gene_type:complete
MSFEVIGALPEVIGGFYLGWVRQDSSIYNLKLITRYNIDYAVTNCSPF